MGKKLLTAIIVFLTAFLVYGILINRDSKTNSPSYMKTVNNIDTLVSDQKNSLSKYSIREADINGESTEGGLIKGYYKGNVLMVIEASIFGEMGKKEYEIYFIKQDFTYCIERNMEYDKPVYDSSSNIKDTRVIRYVLVGNRVYEHNRDRRTLSKIDKSNPINEVINDFVTTLSENNSGLED
ncbi:MAG: hypothetical protein ACM3MK_09535 [Chitinophagales bacterium]